MSSIVEGYIDGVPVQLRVDEVECGHLMRADLVPQVQAAIRAGRDAGFFVSISSAWRSMEKQRYLHDGWMEKRPLFNPADRPGYSKHQDGTAIDLAFSSLAEREEFAALAVAHGMTRPTPEGWHFVAGRIAPETLGPEEVTKPGRPTK